MFTRAAIMTTPLHFAGFFTFIHFVSILVAIIASLGIPSGSLVLALTPRQTQNCFTPRATDVPCYVPLGAPFYDEFYFLSL